MALGQAIYGQGRVALVSGGSRGIGAATVRRLAGDVGGVTGQALEMPTAMAF